MSDSTAPAPLAAPVVAVETDAREDALPDVYALQIEALDLSFALEVRSHPRFERPLETTVRQAPLLNNPPWVRSPGKLMMEVSAQGWRFPAPLEQQAAAPPAARPRLFQPDEAPLPPAPVEEKPARTRLRPPRDNAVFKDRLLYLLQPPLEDLFADRRVSLPFKPYPYQLRGIAFLMPRHAALIADEMGLGKAQPLDAHVLTPTGWKRMGDIQVGDAVIGSNGAPTRVTGVYPQGEKEIFRVEFSDGSACECCDDHLWQVSTPLRRWRGSPPRVLPLQRIRQQLTQPNGNRLHFIPLVAPVQFEEQELSVHPYLLGVLLGDGGISTHNIRISNLDQDLLERIDRLLPPGVRRTPVVGSACDWNLVSAASGVENRLIRALQDLKLMGCRSGDKFVPEPYLFAQVADRAALLQGLLDTDGSVRADNNIEYCTVSPRLAEDVRFLIQSLGGTACIRTKKTKRQLAYRMSVILPPGIAPFAIARKASRYHERRKYPPVRAIVAVTPIGRKPAQCIAVEANDHLYVTDDCIVTHNTMQTIVALRLMFHAGLIHRALVVCPKPLVVNWTRELKTWAPDVPFEVFGGDLPARRATWRVSNCPLKLVNYELLTRDADELADERVSFDVVVLDEAQRIKNRESKTAQVVRSIRRERSWAMTGTPIENRTEDLVNIFAFVDKDRIPPDTPAKMLPSLTSDCILRRTKEEVVSDMPPRIIKDAYLELSPAQRLAYDKAEKEGIVQLNQMGETITVQHVFELVMRLKQICNFDPVTKQSAKLEQLLADMAEVAENGRKAIIFSQWVEPLEKLAVALKDFGPLLYHGKVPHSERQPILDRFRSDPSKHVILMSYGTGSVGLNLQFTNYVFLFDRWWNPAIEDQAINRAHRLGQKSSVFVTRFISQGTIEGRIHEVLEKKRQLFNELIEQNGPPPTLGLSENEVFGLFDIQARPRRGAA